MDQALNTTNDLALRYRDIWLERLLSTESIDMEIATPIINQWYFASGHTYPKSILKCASPLALFSKQWDCTLDNSASRKMEPIRERLLQSNLGKWIGSMEPPPLFLLFSDSALLLSEFSITQTRTPIEQRYFSLLNVISMAEFSCMFSMKRSLHTLVSSSLLATDSDKDASSALLKVTKHCGSYWAPYQNVIRCTAKLDRQSNIAMASVFTLGMVGTYVPECWITDTQRIAASEVLKCGNIEQRRAGCEILGWDRILNELKCEVVEEDPDPLMGTLLEVDLPDSGKERFLKVKCGTGRDFVIPVPLESPSAAWTYGMQDDLGSFRPRLRT